VEDEQWADPLNAGHHDLLIGFDLAGEGLERFQTVFTRSRIRFLTPEPIGIYMFGAHNGQHRILYVRLFGLQQGLSRGINCELGWI
jgi:hypothetical protein